MKLTIYQSTFNHGALLHAIWHRFNQFQTSFLVNCLPQSINNCFSSATMLGLHFATSIPSQFHQSQSDLNLANEQTNPILWYLLSQTPVMFFLCMTRALSSWYIKFLPRSLWTLGSISSLSRKNLLWVKLCGYHFIAWMGR